MVNAKGSLFCFKILSDILFNVRLELISDTILRDVLIHICLRILFYGMIAVLLAKLNIFKRNFSKESNGCVIQGENSLIITPVT